MKRLKQWGVEGRTHGLTDAGAGAVAARGSEAPAKPTRRGCSPSASQETGGRWRSPGAGRRLQLQQTSCDGAAGRRGRARRGPGAAFPGRGGGAPGTAGPEAPGGRRAGAARRQAGLRAAGPGSGPRRGAGAEFGRGPNGGERRRKAPRCSGAAAAETRCGGEERPGRLGCPHVRSADGRRSPGDAARTGRRGSEGGSPGGSSPPPPSHKAPGGEREEPSAEGSVSPFPKQRGPSFPLSELLRFSSILEPFLIQPLFHAQLPPPVRASPRGHRQRSRWERTRWHFGPKTPSKLSHTRLHAAVSSVRTQHHALPHKLTATAQILHEPQHRWAGCESTQCCCGRVLV